MGLAIAVAIRSFDPSLFTQLIVPYPVTRSPLERGIYNEHFRCAS